MNFFKSAFPILPCPPRRPLFPSSAGIFSGAHPVWEHFQRKLFSRHTFISHPVHLTDDSIIYYILFISISFSAIFCNYSPFFIMYLSFSAKGCTERFPSYLHLLVTWPSFSSIICALCRFSKIQLRSKVQFGIL